MCVCVCVCACVCMRMRVRSCVCMRVCVCVCVHVCVSCFNLSQNNSMTAANTHTHLMHETCVHLRNRRTTSHTNAQFEVPSTQTEIERDHHKEHLSPQCLSCLHHPNHTPAVKLSTHNTCLSVCPGRKSQAFLFESERMISSACCTCCNACINEFRCRTPLVSFMNQS